VGPRRFQATPFLSDDRRRPAIFELRSSSQAKGSFIAILREVIACLLALGLILGDVPGQLASASTVVPVAPQISLPLSLSDLLAPKPEFETSNGGSPTNLNRATKVPFVSSRPKAERLASVGSAARGLPAPPSGGSGAPTSCSAGSCVTLSGQGTASGSAAARIDLSWTTLANAVSYNVFRSTVSGGPYTLLGNTTTTAYSDRTGLVNGHAYYYVVQPLNSSGGILCHSNEPQITIPAPASGFAISGFAPDQGVIGASIAISGLNFGSSPGSVTFNGVASTPTYWAPSRIVVPVPSGASTGNLVVTLSGTSVTAGTFTVTSQPPPIASAGLNQTLSVGATAQLDGSGSSDPAGVALSYQWTIVSKPTGSGAVLASATSVQPTFVGDVAGEYAIQLIVTDRYSSSDPSVVIVNTQAVAPVANAGPNLLFPLGAQMLLTGSASTDANGFALTYQWSIVSAPPGPVSFYNANTVAPTIQIYAAGTLVLQLVVNNGCYFSAPSTVTLSSSYVPPTANAGPNQSVILNSAVQLDGSGSTDFAELPLTYAWSILSAPQGSNAILSSAQAVQPNFTADRLGTYVLQLLVNDGRTSSVPSTVEISTNEMPPVARIGKQGLVTPVSSVTLDGTKSTASNGQSLSYSWSLLTVPSGSAAALTSTSSATPSFTADLSGYYVAQLIVNDGVLNSSPATAWIYTSTGGFSPVANAGPNQTVTTGTTVQLDGTNSIDFDNHALTYVWTMLSKPSGASSTLSSTTASKPTFVANVPGLYVLQLIVNDCCLNSQPSTMTVTVPQNQPPTVSAGANQTIELPMNTATLNGSASSSVPAGSPVTVQWTKVSGPGTITFANSTQQVTQATFPGVGTFVLKLTATVTATGLSNSAQTTVTVAPVNQPPVVTVGPDQTITYPTVTVNLTGTATDDGYPVGSSLVIFWSKVTGPGTVTFTNAAQPNTQATFSLPGTYVLRLSASDGQYTSTGTMRVTFVGPTGGPLTVIAGPNQVIVYPSSANLAGTVSDPFLPPGNSVTTQWTQISGPGTATFANAKSLATSVSFSKAGVYDLRLSATDGVSSGLSDVFIYVGHITCTRSSKGTDFWLMFLGGYPPSELDISSDSATSGVVNIPGLSFSANFTVVPGQITKLQVPSGSLVTASDLVETKGIHVTALNPVSVVGFNLYPGEPADGFLALPSNTLGTNYAVLSFPNSNYYGPGTGFGITATKDGTTATIVPSVAIGSRQALAPYTITLNQGQTYQLKDESRIGVIGGTQGPNVDLTGTVITSNNPIAVFGSHNCASSPDSCGQLIEQLPPTNLWGQNFVLMPYANALQNTILHVLASVDGTHVLLNGKGVATLNHSEFTEQVLTGPSVLSADSPVLVAQYGGQGDSYPSMAIVPPFEQFGGSYTISSPFNTQPGQGKADFINVIAPTSAANSGGIFFDGNSVSSTAFTPIGTSGFSGAQVFVTPGPHTVTGILPFHITAYGYADDDGYAYPGGMCLATGAAGSTLTLSPKTATNQITSQVTLSAVVKDSFGAPQGGVGVTFQVTGANPKTVTNTTDSTGTATYSYRGTATGADAVTASADTASDTAVLTWIGNGPNQAPVVTAGANLTITLPTSTVTLFGTVIDDGLPAGGGLTSQWTVVSGPGQVSFTTPTQPITNASFNTAGTYVLKLSASDSQLTGSATTTVVVNPTNKPPVVSAGPAQTIAFLGVSSTSTILNGSATDDGLPTGSTLAINWAEVSGAGTISFAYGQNSPTASVRFSAPGTYIMSLSASDGQFTTTSYATVYVIGPPVVTTVSPLQGIVNTAIPVQGAITLNGQANAGTVTPFWEILSGPSGYQANFANSSSTLTTFQTNLPGAYQIELCAGTGAFCSVATVSVLPVGGANPPAVSFASPADGAELTRLTSITGNVSSGNWVLEYAPQNDLTPQLFTALATGSGSVTAGTLGTFDPTLLLNGQYTVRLRTQDNYGLTASATITVSVTRNMKVGVVTISFNDLTVPVAGVPIQIIRTYDSRDKSIGDFGVGWHLSLANVRIQKTHGLGLGWTETQQTSGGFPSFCVQVPNPAIVTVVFPDGRTYRFVESLSQTCQSIAPLTATNVTFTQLPGPANTSGATLVPTDGGSVIVDGSAPGAVTLLGFDGNPYSPTAYVMKTADGNSYSIDQILGLTGVTDTNGNSITIGPNGIIHSSGKSVTFHRDTLGRIVDIFDPNSNVLKYSYDQSGELSGFTDRLNNSFGYSYDPLGTHNLKVIVGPDGTTALTNMYDTSGRLLSTQGANGQTVGFTHDVVNRVDTVKDANGNSTTYGYDVDGNVVKKTDPLGNITSSTYDASDNKLSETNPLGKTTNYTYDQLGNRLTESDPLGHTTTYTYNALSKPLTIADPNGHSTTNAYDANGNLLTTTDPNGKTTTNTYTGKGQLATTKDPLGSTTSFAYDGSGNLTSQTDANGTVTTYTYDSNGNRNSQAVTRTKSDGTKEALITQYFYDANSHLTKTTYPDGSFTQVKYDSSGRQSATIDARGNTTSYSYDLTGRLTQTSYPDSTTDQANYDPNGNRTRSITRAGVMTNYVYDAANRVAQTLDSGQHPLTATVYDAAGQVLSSKDGNGNITQYAYDDAGRRTTVTDALTHVTTFVYDAAGNQTSVKDANNNTTAYTYDNANRRTRVTYPDGKFESTAYDALGRVVSRTDAKGLTTQYGYDALGRLTSVTDGLNQVTSYAYDEVGDRITQADANTHATTYAYDQRGRRIQRKLPLGQTEGYAYDANGNLATRTDFNGKATTYTYDAMNQLLSKTPDASFHAPAVIFVYNTGQRHSMTDATGTTTLYFYDNRGRLSQKTNPSYSLTYTYDLAGNLTQFSSPAANVTYTYDVLNRLSTVAEVNTGTTSYSYDNVGNLLSVMYPNGVAHSYTYDNRNRLKNLGVAKGASNLFGYTYTLDASGHRTAVTELSGRTVNYGYDNLYRLTSETIGSDPNAVNGSVTYTYDPVGNRTQKTSTLPGFPGGLLNYNANDQLTTDTYDADGNTVGSGTNTGANGYVYDFENHLIQQGGISIVYDGDGNRVSKTVAGVTTTYVVDAQNPTGYAQVLQETFSGGTGSNRELSHSYVYGLERISERRNYLQNNSGTNSNAYYVYDGHGSVRALTNATGAVTDTYDYDAFGNLIHQTGSTPNNYLFAGEQFDPDLHLYYNRARYLNTNTGRFINMDTFEGRSQDPLSLHKYLYVAADPVNRVDPRGKDFVDSIAAISISVTLFVSSVPQIISEAFEEGAQFGGTVLAEFGQVAENYAGQVLALVEDAIPEVEVLSQRPVGQRIIDFVVRNTETAKQLFIEVKFGLPSSAEALSRLVAQIQAASQAAQQSGGQVVVWTLKNLTPQQLQTLESEIGNSEVQVVSGVENLYKVVTNYFQ
jgi:RHS repeat-associated protein